MQTPEERRKQWNLLRSSGKFEIRNELPLSAILAKADIHMPDEADRTPEYAARLAAFEQLARSMRWTEKEKIIGYMRLGVVDGKRCTVDEVAQKLQMPRERVRRLEYHAWTRGEHGIRRKQLVDDPD